MDTSWLTYLAPIGAVVAILFAVYLARKVLKAAEGNDLMKKISACCPSRVQMLT